MNKAYLLRQFKSNLVTLGYLFIGGEVFRTLERPWKNNARNISCIPPGTYHTTYLPRSASGKYKKVFHVREVPGRGGILIHNGNLVSHTKGCILLGTRVGNLGGEKAVLSSRIAMREFNKVANKQDFELEVIG